VSQIHGADSAAVPSTGRSPPSKGRRRTGRRNEAGIVTRRPGQYRANAGRRSDDQPGELIGHFRRHNAGVDESLALSAR
jgi:hypothetical protein